REGPVMDPLEEHLTNITRRRFFMNAAKTIGAGMGATALGSLLGTEQPAIAADDPARDILAQIPHIAPKAKRVIYLHMEGAPSQIDLFDYKPGLRHRFNEDLPDSIRDGQRITGMTSGQARFPVAPSIFRFSKYANNQDGVWISELMPHTAKVAHELCFIR